MGEREQEVAAHEFSEAGRKIVHIGLGLVAFTLGWLGWKLAAAVAAAAIVFNWLILPRVGGKRIARREAGNDRGIILYPVAVFLLIVIFRDRLEIAAVGWVVLAFGDGIASIVGRNIGGPALPWNRKKTALGTFAFWEVALPMSWLVVLVVGERETLLPNLLILFVTVTLAAIVEGLDTGIDDNILVPFVAAFTMFALQEVVRVPLVNWSREAKIWLGVNVVLAIVGYLGKSVNLSGFVGGIALGTILIVFGGWQAYVLLLAFFVIGSAGTKLGYGRKARLGVAQEGEGRRGFSHAFANVGCAAILLVLGDLTGWDMRMLWLAAAAALATATADTTASEIGQLIGKRPFMPLTFRRVPVGTEGAISIEGTAAGALTGSFVALLGAAGWHSFGNGVSMMSAFEGSALSWTLSCAGLIAISAVAGSWLESVAGSWNRRNGSPISNGTLNFFNTAAGAAIMIGLSRFLS
jgi:uncharacterized protein (TIGR00297 family)